MPREMLINVSQGEEVRIAVVEDGRLEEFYIERAGSSRHVGNIYKGKIVNIESGIQAVFIDFDEERNGFLHTSDLHPRYWSKSKKRTKTKTKENSIVLETIGQRKALSRREPIQKSLRKGQEIVVQVTKEGINTKGPTLSTYLALPGKYLVMMPWMSGFGISHKIEDEAERLRLRGILEGVKLPKDMGFIIRTAGAKCTKREIQNDLRYLKRLWKTIEKRIKTEKAPASLFRESDLVIRTLRDVFDRNIKKIICDSEAVTGRIRDFLGIAMPTVKKRATYYDGKVPLFHKYNIEEAVGAIHSRRVNLKGGGSIIIEQTEALVAIDVNSGRSKQGGNAEETAFRTNQEAADEIARQLRLRDLGGLIICDFIDMRSEKHRRQIEKAFRESMKSDRARSRVLRISQFGVVEMTRQRMRPSLQSTTYLDCPLCGGSGHVKSKESVAIEVLRLLGFAVGKNTVKKIELRLSPEVGSYLQNEKRATIHEMEQGSGKQIMIRTSHEHKGENYDLVCYNERGSEVKV